MKISGLLFRALLFLSLVMIPVLQAYAQDGQDLDEETILVGRISHIKGDLLRYDPETGDWLATVKDSPFGVDDILLTSVGGKAEIIMPNNTWARMDCDTQIQLIAISEDLTEVDLASGKARLYNKSSGREIKASTPFGYVTAPAETTFDLYVGERDMEVIAIEGAVYFVHNASDTRHEVIAGSSAVSADIMRVAVSEGSLSPGWDEWNRERDVMWAKRMQAKGESADYLPPSLHEEAYVLEKYGRWENVNYDGSDYHFWRPVHIRAGWAPFTVGRWSMWCGDHVWLPYEPFGYLTHHYGNWIFTQGYWYWAPPVTGVMAYAGIPLLKVGFSWYPGRVGWIYSGAHVGWIPLAPYEPYYGYRRWGRYSFVVASKKSARFHFNIHKYRHRRHAVIIHRNHFYRVNNYKNARIRGISHGTVVNRFRMATVINKAVRKGNYRAIQKRRRRDKRSIAEALRKAKRQMRRSSAGMVRKGGRRNVQNKVDKAIERSERRKSPEIMRQHRVRQERRSVKVIENQDKRVRRSEAPAPQVRQERPKRRVEKRTERRIARKDRQMLQRQQNQSSMRTESREKRKWRGNRSSVFSH